MAWTSSISSRPGAARARRGGALLIALVPMILVSFLAAAFMQLSGVMLRGQRQSLDMKRVFYLCEAGLYEGMAGLHLGRTGSVASRADPAYFGGGYFWVEATEPGPSLVQLDSFAFANGARAQLSWVVQKVPFNFAAFGFFASDELKVEKGSLVDGYDSSLGSYAEQVAAGLTTTAGRLASNGAIELEGDASRPTTVHGSAQPGLGAGVEIDPGVTLTGDTNSLDEFMLPPEFFVPELPVEKDIKHNAARPRVLPPGDRAYEKIEVGKKRELIVRGPATLVIDELRVGEGAKLTLDTTDGPVKLHVLREAKLNEAAELRTTSGSPRDAYLLIGDGVVGGDSGKASLGKKTRVTALVFAPQDEVEVKEGAEVFGAVVADELDLGEGVKLHFDRVLGAQENQTPRHVTWCIVDLGEGPIDPFRHHGLLRSALRGPAAAHADVWLEIKYRSVPGGPKLEYVGWWNDFDWDAVLELAPHYKVYDEPGGEELIHVHP